MAMTKAGLIKRLEEIQSEHNKQAEFIRGLIRTAKNGYDPDTFVESDLFDDTKLYCPTSTSFRNNIAKYADENRRGGVCANLDSLENHMFGLEIDKAKDIEKKEVLI